MYKDNLFSAKQIHFPSAVQFRQHLKLITLSQITDVPKCSSYDIDDTPNLIDFIRSHSKTRKADVDYLVKHNFDLPSIDETVIGYVEEKGLYYIAGWVGLRVSSAVKGCDECSRHLFTDNPLLSQSSLTSTMSYGGLKHPSDELFQVIQNAESFFRSHDISHASTEKITQAMLAQSPLPLSTCMQHNLLELAVRKFYKLRIHIRARFLTEQINLQKQYASKSAAQRTVIK